MENNTVNEYDETTVRLKKKLFVEDVHTCYLPVDITVNDYSECVKLSCNTYQKTEKCIQNFGLQLQQITRS